jgi:hypothetical protein
MDSQKVYTFELFIDVCMIYVVWKLEKEYVDNHWPSLRILSSLFRIQFSSFRDQYHHINSFSSVR